MVEIPVQLEKYFTHSDFKSYPKLNIPQKFVDERGTIINIADGEIGDVAIIQSKKSAIRANHLHHSDWHLSYCLSGSLIYSYLNQELKVCSTRIFTGELFFTPEEVPHRMDFIEDTILVVASKNSRLQERYEEDTKKYFLNLPVNE